jgi:hypothetical protein
MKYQRMPACCLSLCLQCESKGSDTNFYESVSDPLYCAPFIGFGLCSRLIALAALLLSGCVSTGGYITGQVLDADTREPIPDAHVVITWRGGEFAVVETKTLCIRADATLTDADGNFRFLPWAQWDGILPKSDEGSFIFVYKPGYFDTYYYHALVRMIGKTVTEGDARLHLLKRFESGGLSRKEYMDYLLQVSSWANCGTDKANLVPISRAVYAEAERLAQTNDEKEKAGTIYFGLEVNEFGYGEATKRQREREHGK